MATVAPELPADTTAKPGKSRRGSSSSARVAPSWTPADPAPSANVSNLSDRPRRKSSTGSMRADKRRSGSAKRKSSRSRSCRRNSAGSGLSFAPSSTTSQGLVLAHCKSRDLDTNAAFRAYSARWDPLSLPGSKLELTHCEGEVTDGLPTKKSGRSSVPVDSDDDGVSLAAGSPRGDAAAAELSTPATRVASRRITWADHEGGDLRKVHYAHNLQYSVPEWMHDDGDDGYEPQPPCCVVC